MVNVGKKGAFAIALLVVLATAPASLLLVERNSILGFYGQKAPVSCGTGDASGAVVKVDLERHAISNFYIGHLIDSGVGSHVSIRIAYHRLAADFVTAHLITGSEVHELFGKAPCGYRRP